MHRRLLGPACLLAATAAVVGLLAHALTGVDAGREPQMPATPVARTVPLALGISFGEDLTRATPAEMEHALDDVVALHGTWLRIDLSWTSLQPTSPSSTLWAPVDRVLAAAAQRHLRVLGVLTWTPAWARSPGCEVFTCPPADPAAFARFGAQVVTRYPTTRLAAIEVWNEPNIAKFWPRPDPAAYGRLFAASIAAIHAVRPRTRVLVGGLAANLNRSGRRGIVEAGPFLRAACSSGRCAHAAGVAFHPYTFPRTALDGGTPLTSWQRMRRGAPGRPSLRTVMDGIGLHGVPLWVTEYGAPSQRDPQGDSPVDQAGRSNDPGLERLQADIDVTGVRAAAATPQDVLAALFLHTLQDSGVSGTGYGHFGLRRDDGTRKPAYAAVAHAFARARAAGPR